MTLQLYKTIICSFMIAFSFAGSLLLALPTEVHAQQPTQAVSITQKELDNLRSAADFKAAWTDFANIGFLLAQLTGWLMRTAADILSMAGILLNAVVQKLVVGMGGLVNSINGIDVAWTVLRDVSNLVFVFGLLVIGIATILSYQPYGYRQLLTRLILVALLINFSLFTTKFIIDGANLFTVEIYGLIIPPVTNADCAALNYDAEVSGQQAAYLACLDSGISGAFMNQIGLTSVYSAEKLLGYFQDQDKGSNDLTANGMKAAKIFFFTTIFFLIMAFVFFVAAILLIIRFIVLVVLIIFSPVAFVAMIMPVTRGLANKWWNTLFRQAFFAPAMFLMIWVSLHVLDGLRLSIAPNTGGATFVEAFALDGGSMTLILNFAIVVGLLISSIMVATYVGGQAASVGVNATRRFGTSARRNTMRYAVKPAARTAGRTARTATSAGLRNTVGYGASTLANKGWLKEKAATNRFARAAHKTAQRVEKANFGGDPKKGGYKKRLDARIKAEQEYAESLGKVGNDDKAVQALKDRKTDAVSKKKKKKKDSDREVKQLENQKKDELRQMDEQIADSNRDVARHREQLQRLEAAPTLDHSAIATKRTEIANAEAHGRTLRDQKANKDMHLTEKIANQRETSKKIEENIKKLGQVFDKQINREKNRRQINYANARAQERNVLGVPVIAKDMDGNRLGLTSRHKVEGAQKILKKVSQDKNDEILDTLRKVHDKVDTD